MDRPAIILGVDYVVRHMREGELPLLEEFLYQAVWVPEDFEGEVPRSVVREDPKCRAAYEGFGSLPDDRALVAEVGGKAVGACWVRTTDEYGHIDAATPSFSISLRPESRGRGVGTALMRRMLSELEGAGYARASLSVQKANPALRLYERLGFRIVGNGADETEWLMVRALREPFEVIETDRLILRPWLASDAPALYELAGDPDVGPAAGWPPHASLEESAIAIATALSAPGTYAVVVKATGELAGCAGLNSGDAANMALRDGERELGYWIGKPHWGRGYATEAARAVVERGFGKLGLSAIHAAYRDGNDRSRRVLGKLGFAPVRTERGCARIPLGETQAVHFARLGADAWLSRIRPASEDDAEAVHELVQQTMRAAYPSCYSPAVVEAFCRLHSLEAIAADVAEGKVCVLESRGRIVGTGTLDGNHVTRVFVLPSEQGRGHGTRIMDALEAEAAGNSHETVVLDSSAPARSLYLHRGYTVARTADWRIEATGGFPAATLTYEIMEKTLPAGGTPALSATGS